MKLERFIEELCELEIDPQLLREDPSGASWLPRAMRNQVARDPGCARELAEFVEMELALLEVHEPSDAFFTRRVMDSLPELESVDDRRRTWILASAYALAIGVAYVLLGPMLSEGSHAAKVVEPLHDWYHSHAVEAGGMWVVLALLLSAFVLVVLPTGSSRRLSSS